MHYGLRVLTMSVLILLIVITLLFGVDVYRLLYHPMIEVEDAQAVLRLDKSASATSFVKTLYTKGFIQSPRLFLILIRLEGLSSTLKAGIYQLKAFESAQQFLCRVSVGDVLTDSIAIIEGTTLQQFIEKLKASPYLNDEDSDWQGLAPTVSAAEGLLLADTYRYTAGSSSRDLLVRAHKALESYLDRSWKNRAPNLPYQTPYQLLIVASILEKETSQPEEKRLISGVIVNRLKRGMPLQMDPTVIYGLGSAYQGKLTHESLLSDSPYNTYRYRGLPPTPIATVGRDAIDAAAHPMITDYLYFVAKGDGTHQFSATYEQQKQAIRHYLRQGL
jgi:UPF0755 protein